MRKWLNNYFEFSRREFNGLMVLLILLAGVSVFPMVYRALRPQELPTAEEQLAVLKFAMASQPEAYKKMEPRIFSAKGHLEKRKSVLFYFDPNVIDIDDWQKLGLSEKQAQAILNYRSKGGVFRKKTDLQKMYTISAQLYNLLEPYVQIAGTELSTPQKVQAIATTPVPISKELKLIELNGADTLELDQIKGIGMVFARRIVAYRERIGGFHKKEQLMEVFGIDSLKYNEVKNQVSIDPDKLKKININTAELADFKNHPYIRYKQVNALIQYRKQHGNYSNIADLNKVAILTPEIIGRLAPYLIF
ncbi:competence protein ComEA helix-hairpin-helix repeat region [Pedobacter steynii]|uniref:Competence protein ComEA helix-hairpin-helix repeat region n=1 Tax=Pedobacter steynii TaxID=430522 RepID=A0A1H0I1L0_9SPHI|nr:helix-hairpin-helix domain-containing protein [Pedobacter steynii]NQX42758.1 helix-hairpin-helix domain-containing protein [Pedobacter steynii]SDO25264.1 competence protein ComEA helix-hairpin-helix repeat region [Pedobacter steynii]